VASWFTYFLLVRDPKKGVIMSSGSGKIMVEFFSADMVFRVCR
jgi:hypothetical protein